VRAIVMDVEGTTSSIAFVKDVLFPYSRRHLPDFLRRHAHRPDVAAALDEARALAKEPSLDVDGLTARLLAWLDEDRKAPPLKLLQGLIWEAGYANGDYRGHVYPDVPPALARWHAAGSRLYVYSSGSVAAQQLLFRHSVAGDLTPLLSGYFDTGVGAKTSVDSYRTLAAAIGSSASAILFLSDSRAELDAARGAGMQTVQLCREGLVPAGTHLTAESFDRL
jgi:enolase-phosphatase E1